MSRAEVMERLRDRGLELPAQSPPKHPYLATREDRGVVYLSGKTAMRDGVVRFRGPVSDDTIEVGRDAARLCALQVIAAIDASVGLDNLEAILRLTVYVWSTPDFEKQPEVANAASELLVELLGPAGGHTRSAVGVAALPGGTAVEIDAIIRVSGGDGQ